MVRDLEIKIKLPDLIKEEICIKESFLKGIADSWVIMNYLPYAALSYYDVLLEAHLI